MQHQRLVYKATRAINAVFNDQTVSPEQVLKSIELLHDEIHILIDAIGDSIETEAAMIREKSHKSTTETIGGF